MGFIEERKREIILCSFAGVLIMTFLVSAETKLPGIEQHEYWVGGFAIIGAVMFFINYWEKPAGRQYSPPPPHYINDEPHGVPIPPPQIYPTQPPIQPRPVIRPQKVYPQDNADPGTTHVVPMTEPERRAKKKEKKAQDAKTEENR